MAARLEKTMADSETQLKKALHCYNDTFGTNITSVKNLQKDLLLKLIDGHDVMCCIPTGYGKSLIYELLPFVDTGCLVIVVVPLDAIIEQQLSKLGAKAASLKSKVNLMDGQIQYLFCHPEQILGNKDISRQFCSQEMKKRQVYCVIDEVHCMLEWGTDFRPEFRNLYELKAMLGCPTLTLSATVTKTAQKQISSGLLLHDPAVISATPLNNKLSLTIKTRPSPTAKGNSSTSPYDYICIPLLQQLKCDADNFPNTVVYFKTLQWIGYVYELAKRTLEDKFLVDNEHPRVLMFHSSMERESGKLKKMILDSLSKPFEECHLRLLFSSVALGMGADLKHVTRVIHAGPPTNLESYVQEVGRAGRSGQLAEAVLFFNRSDLGAQNVRAEMRNYCTNSETCRRSVINKYFGFETETTPVHCCDICDPSIGLNWDFAKTSLSNS